MSALDELRDRVEEVLAVAEPEAGKQPHLLAGVEAAMAEVETELDELRAERDALAGDRSYLGARAQEMVAFLGLAAGEGGWGANGAAPEPAAALSGTDAGQGGGTVILTVAPLSDVATAAALEYRLGGIEGVEEARLHQLGESCATIELRLAHPVRLAEELLSVLPAAAEIHDSPEGLRVELRAVGG